MFNSDEFMHASPSKVSPPLGSKPIAILVLGMHRSGTSVLTRLINLLGADLPHKLIPSNEGNESGYWESGEINRAHDKLFASISRAWDQPSGISSLLDDAKTIPFGKKILELLYRDFSNSAMFVVKDPRVSLLVPFWVDLLEEFGAEPRFVFCIRNPLEVVQSLAKRNEFTQAKSMLLWLAYMLQAELHTRDHRRVFVMYDDLLQDWRNVAANIGEALDIQWPRSPQLAAGDVEQFIRPTQQHHNATDDALFANNSVIPWVKDAYRQFRAAAQHQSPDWSVLDQIRAEYEQAEQAFGPLVAEHHEATWNLWYTRRELQQVKQHAEQVHATAAESHEKSRQHINALQKSQDEHMVTGETLRQQLRSTNDQYNLLQETHRQLCTQFQQQYAYIQQLQRQLSDKQADSQRLVEQLTLHRSAIERMEKHINDVSSALLQLQLELAAERQAKNKAEGENEKLDQQFREQSSELMNVKNDYGRLNQRNADLSEQVAVLTGQITHLREKENRLSAELDDMRHSFSWRLTAPFRWRQPDHAVPPPSASPPSPAPKDKELPPPTDDATSIRNSGIFDSDYYISLASPLRQEDPILDYLSRGDDLQCNPQWLFHGAFYLISNPDVAASKINPFVHFLTTGWKEHRNPHPMFDMRYYLNANPDVAAAGINPLIHFLQQGWKENRNPNRLFDVRFYLETQPDVAAAGMNPVQHYILYGQHDGRNPGPLFDSAHYHQFNPEHVALKLDPLSHYLWIGIHQQRSILSPARLMHSPPPEIQ